MPSVGKAIAIYKITIATQLFQADSGFLPFPSACTRSRVLCHQPFPSACFPELRRNVFSNFLAREEYLKSRPTTAILPSSNGRTLFNNEVLLQCTASSTRSSLKLQFVLSTAVRTLRYPASSLGCHHYFDLRSRGHLLLSILQHSCRPFNHLYRVNTTQ